MARDYRVINVGSHANPPGDMYERYFPAEIGHLAPKLVTREFPAEGVFECIELEGEYIRQLSTQTGIKLVDAQDIPFIKTFDEGFAGQRDPAARLADMDKDGVDADVIVSPGYPILLPKNRETRWGMMYAWNGWLAELCAHDPERLIGIGEIPLWDIPRAIEEAKRVKSLGLKGVLMPAVPGYVGCWSSPADAPYTSPVYAPLWDALEDLGLVMVVHADAAAATPGLENYDNAGVNMIINKTLPSEMIASLICGHVFRDHPGLKLLCVETGIGWMAHLIAWMDVLLREHPTMYPGITELPSVQFRKHVYGSFLWDTIGVANRDLIGVDNIMWCNDYPHSYGPYPNSNSRIALELKDVPEDEQLKILAGNAMRVFGLGQYAQAATDKGAGVSLSLRLEAAPNFRDFGGHATSDGRRVRTGMLFRSSQLSGLSDADLAAVAGLGLRCVIDLRALDERTAQPARWRETPAFRFESAKASLAEEMKQALAGTSGAERVRTGFSTLYARLPELYVEEYRALFGRLAGGDVPLLVNCTAGKDRTGVAAALILSTLGVPRETVIADYVETNARFGDLRSAHDQAPVAGAAAAVVADHATSQAARDAVWAADPRFLALALDAVARDHGSIDAYVADRLGIGRDGIVAMRESLTEAV